MLITKEQQESLVSNYVKAKHNQDKCIGFIDGIEAIIVLIDRLSKTKPLEERKAIFKSKLSDKLGKYGVKMIEEFFDYWTKLYSPNLMKFESIIPFHIESELKDWDKYE